uniref:SDE2-like domain-containing protein n=1 Tax=Anopheles coluzzii TaxID=1518534 RepID=A0A8W7PLM3_ANOCL
MYSIAYGGELLQLPVGSEGECNIPLAIERWTGLLPSEYYCTQNGRRVSAADHGNLVPDVPLRVCERLPGGKGGFGSMLRAIGAQIEKTTNREACRDLSGRRLRDINEEKRLKAYLEKQQEAEDNERVKAERKIAKLQSKPKHEFHDKEYEHARSELVVAADEAIEEGLQNAIVLEMEQAVKDAVTAEVAATAKTAADTQAKDSRKRKLPDTKSKKAPAKKGALWLGVGDLSSSSETDDDSTDESSDGAVAKGKLVAV